MKVLFFSRYGDGADLALDMRRGGHEVRVWIQDPKRRPYIWTGLIEKVDDWRKSLDWADWCFFDANGLTKEWDQAVKKKPCFGGSAEGEKMEKDRAFAHKLMAAVGMAKFESVSFKTIDEAQKHLQEHKVKHVAKLVGGDADSDDVLISEMESGEDAIELMERFKEQGKKYDVVEVEERVFGVEVGCAGYFNGKDWVGPIEVNFQHKEVAAGWRGSDRGLGLLCGETGTVIRYVTAENAFFKKTLDLFSDHLRNIDYRGEIDIGTITNAEGIFPIEFTPRKGYPDCFIRRALAKTPEADLYAAVAAGKPLDVQTLPGWAIGYLVMAPGFPYQDAVKKHAAGYPVFGYDEKNPGMHLMEVTKVKRGIQVADGCGYLAVVTAAGPTIESAQRRAYWLVNPANEKRLYSPKSWVRADIGDRVLAQKDEILEFGIVTEAEWAGEGLAKEAARSS